MIKQICRAVAFMAPLGQLNPRCRRIQTRLLIIQFTTHLIQTIRRQMIGWRNVERLSIYPVVGPLAMLFDLVGPQLANHGREVLWQHVFLQT